MKEQAENSHIELLRQIAAGDGAAFAEFYDLFSTFLFSIAFTIVKDASEAEDVSQEAFLQIWEKARSFDPKLGKTSSWVAMILHNKAIDRIRIIKRRTCLAEKAGIESVIANEISETANETLYGREKAKLIQSAIAELPAEQRQAIELAYFSGLTQNEISEKLQEPLGTIKARIRRSLLKLRNQLEKFL